MKKIFMFVTSALAFILIVSFYNNEKIYANGKINSYGIKYYLNKKGINNYKLLNIKKFKNMNGNIGNTKWVYSKNMKYSYKVGDGSFFMTTSGNSHKILSKRIFYNKRTKKDYIFYEINNFVNPKKTYLINEKWVNLENQKGLEDRKIKLSKLFNNYNINKSLNYLAYEYASYIDNNLESDGSDGKYITYFDLANNVVNNSSVKAFELKSDKNKYSKNQFKNFRKNKLSFEKYVKNLFINQFGSINKYGSNKNIGIYIYPNGSKLYGNVIFVISNNNMKINENYIK